jgi:hypothetical protein
MNHFDSSIITFLNSFARHSWAFDSFVYMISGNNLFKGGLIVALISVGVVPAQRRQGRHATAVDMRDFCVFGGGAHRPRVGDYACFS